MIKFRSNLKGLNEIQKENTRLLLSDNELKDLVNQIGDKFDAYEYLPKMNDEEINLKVKKVFLRKNAGKSRWK